MLNWISGIWCKTMHRKAMWPIHGRYLCPQCLHEYAVSWEQSYVPAAVVTQVVTQVTAQAPSGSSLACHQT